MFLRGNFIGSVRKRVQATPTHGAVDGSGLIRVGVTRDIRQAVPVEGSFVGAPGDYLGMTVDVAVISERRAEPCRA